MSKNVLITGGAGFIGTNTAEYYLNNNYNVTILDNFSRFGSTENAKYLKQLNKKNLKIIKHDIRVYNKKLSEIVESSDIIFHFAAQVAVTTSVKNPIEDAQININGTLNILEAARRSKKNPIILYSSTNKVYGNLEDKKIEKKQTRYIFKNNPYGIPELAPLDLFSPYGCSKGAADQYVHDYSRIYGLETIVFRQSCIYGPHQFGIEDQGWIAWFLIAIMQNKKITIYGDGKQVRDLLFVEDLIKAYDLAVKNIKKTQGQIYNIGGGWQNTISVWAELEPILNKIFNKKINVVMSNERPGDQKIFISDIRKAKKEFGWKPEINVEDGITRLFEWLKKNKSIII